MNHLTLEQCQKLKELGFPQGETLVEWVEYMSGGSHFKIEITSQDPDYDWYSCPTLEELIEWLPEYILKQINHAIDDVEDFHLQFHLWYSKKGNAWFADYSDKRFTEYMNMGETPLEAVYNLAIAVKEAK